MGWPPSAPAKTSTSWRAMRRTGRPMFAVRYCGTASGCSTRRRAPGSWPGSAIPTPWSDSGPWTHSTTSVQEGDDELIGQMTQDKDPDIAAHAQVIVDLRAEY